MENVDQTDLNGDMPLEEPRGEQLDGLDPQQNEIDGELPSGYVPQSEFTKKAQAAAAAEKQRDELQARLEAMQNPRALRAMLAAYEANAPEQTQQGFSIPNPYEGVSWKEKLDPELEAPLGAYIHDYLEKHALPHLAPFLQAVGQMQNSTATQKWEKIESQYPIAKELQPQVLAFMQQNPKADIDAAFFAVAGPRLLQAQGTREQPQPQARTPNNPKPEQTLLRPTMRAANGSSRPGNGQASEQPLAARDIGRQVVLANPGRFPAGWRT